MSVLVARTAAAGLAGLHRGRAASVFLLLCAATVAAGCATLPDASCAVSGPRAGVMNETARRAFDLVNAERSARALPPLAVGARCVGSAQAHAEDMARRFFFSHRSPTESFGARMRRWALDRSAVGENIGKAAAPEDVVGAWMRSPRHRQSILSPAFTSSGTGFAEGRYVQCFSASAEN